MAATVVGSTALAHEIPLDRVVAVVGLLPDGRTMRGSGFLVDATHVLTAWHCTVQDARVQSPLPFPDGSLQVRRYADGAWQTAVAKRASEPVNGTRRTAMSWTRPATPEGYDWGRDVAVLEVVDPPWGDPGWALPEYRKLDRTQSGEQVDCVAVGFPMYMVAPDAPMLRGEVRGVIRYGDDLESRRLMLRDTGGSLPAVPAHLDPEQTGRQSPWGGLSGAAVFHHGRILGHVVQHHPHRGGNQVTVMPVERIAEGATKHDSASALIARLIGLPDLADLRTLAVHVGIPALERDRVPLPPDPTASLLLRPEFAVVPFTDRRAELQEFRAWLHDDRPAGLWFWHGPAGVGKTRLAAKCVRDAAKAGWIAGFVPRDTGMVTDVLAAAQADAVSVLLVMDDAHSQPTRDIVRLLHELDSRSLVRGRVLLLGRTAGSWWEALREAGADDSPGVSWLLAHRWERCLGPAPRSSKEIERATEAFAKALGVDCESDGEAGSEDSEGSETFLDIHLKTLRAVMAKAKGPIPADAPEDELLAREAARWRTAPSGLPGDAPRGLQTQLVCLACLVGGADLTDERARRILRVLPDLSDASRMVVTGADQWLKGLYPGNGRWPPMRPDRLADRLLAGMRDDGNFQEALGQLPQVTSNACLAEVLMVAGRAIDTEPTCQTTLLAAILSGGPEACIRQAITLGGQAGHTLPDGIAQWLDSHPHPEAAERCERLLPAGSFNLAGLAQSLRQQALQSERAQAGPRRAEILEGLGGATELREAVRIRSTAAAANDPDAQGALAAAWSSLSLAKENDRDYAGATQAFNEALRICEELTADGYAEAFSLHRKISRDRASLLENRGDNLGAFAILDSLVEDLGPALRDTSRPDSQHLRAEYAQIILERGIAAARDPYQRGDYYLRAKNDFENARALFAELEKSNPDLFIGMQSICLLDLAAVLQQMQKYEQGAQAAKDAVKALRPLATARPAYRAELANALLNLGNIEASRESWSSAEAAFGEAADLFHDREDPRAYASVLSSAARVLCEQGLYERSLERASEGIRRLLPFAESAPGGFESIARNLLQSYDEAARRLEAPADDGAATRLAAAVRRAGSA